MQLRSGLLPSVCPHGFFEVCGGCVWLGTIRAGAKTIHWGAPVFGLRGRGWAVGAALGQRMHEAPAPGPPSGLAKPAYEAPACVLLASPLASCGGWLWKAPLGQPPVENSNTHSPLHTNTHPTRTQKKRPAMQPGGHPGGASGRARVGNFPVLATRGVHLVVPGNNNIVPGGTGGGSICFNLRDRCGVGMGVKQGPKTPHLGGQTRLVPRRAAGRCRGGGRAMPCFRCTPLCPGTVKWGP
jgi:hypothetical protein